MREDLEAGRKEKPTLCRKSLTRSSETLPWMLRAASSNCEQTTAVRYDFGRIWKERTPELDRRERVRSSEAARRSKALRR